MLASVGPSGTTATMCADFFFTELDPRAAVKGSRDPLGIQGVWAGLGRQVIGNLTTVTQSARGFTTLLVGLYLADRAADRAKDRTVGEAFLVWEQLAGYARRCFHGAEGLLGQRKIEARTQLGRATLSADPEAQILANQRAYGLWGLYTSAARTSGLVEATGPPRLTAAGQDLVSTYHLPKLESTWGSDARRLVDLLVRDRAAVTISLRNPDLRAIAAMLSPKLELGEVRIYTDHLVNGGPGDPTSGRQGRLATAMRSAGSADAHSLAKVADRDLVAHIDHIRAAESALAPIGSLFSYLLTQDGNALDTVAHNVASTWGQRLESVSPAAGEVLPPQLRNASEALRQGDYQAALELLLERNKTVMTERGGSAAWATLGSTGKLDVRFREDEGGLPSGETVRTMWRNPYFLPSLWNVMGQIEDGIAT